MEEKVGAELGKNMREGGKNNNYTNPTRKKGKKKKNHQIEAGPEID